MSRNKENKTPRFREFKLVVEVFYHLSAALASVRLSLLDHRTNYQQMLFTPCRMLNVFVVFVLWSAAECATVRRPHIVFILADDLGWNDVSFHGSNQIPTPNIDALAYSGVVLNSHYSQPLCSPSRAALLTGKYPIRTGMQHSVVLAPEPWGLPLTERLLPQHLKDLGYATHALGKWHLGYCRKEMTPVYRGFDSHYGFWNGFQDYYTHQVQASFLPFEGYDMRRNMSVDWSAVGRYSTELYTEEAVRIISSHDSKQGPLFLYVAHQAVHSGNYEDPLQAPERYIDKLKHIVDPERRKFAGMVSALDESVGKVMEALRAAAMLKTSIIVLVSDNGAGTNGIHSNRGSNWPLKGIKSTPWEGGVRTVALVWSNLLRKSARVSNQLMHLTDWLPTLYSAAGGDVSQLGVIDGHDMWDIVSLDLPSPRAELLVNIDQPGGYSAIRVGDLKYIKGAAFLGFIDGWVGDAGVQGAVYDFRALTKSLTGRVVTSLGLQLPKNESEAEALRRATQIRCYANATVEETKKFPPCKPLKKPCIFNVVEDPCERRNLYTGDRIIVNFFEERLERYRKIAVPRGNHVADLTANPKYWNNTWTNWKDFPFPKNVVITKPVFFG